MTRFFNHARSDKMSQPTHQNTSCSRPNIIGSKIFTVAPIKFICNIIANNLSHTNSNLIGDRKTQTGNQIATQGLLKSSAIS